MPCPEREPSSPPSARWTTRGASTASPSPRPLARGSEEASLHASMAKAQASEAALLASRIALQAHGAIGYSFEYDLHLWMKRAWALACAWGDAAYHRERVARAILGGDP